MIKKLYHQFACSSMMLPEHRGRLNRCRRQEQWEERHRRPLFDEQQWELFQHTLGQSLRQGLPLKVTILNGRGYHTLVGTAFGEDLSAGRLRLKTADGIKTAPVAEIIDLQIVNSSGDDS